MEPSLCNTYVSDDGQINAELFQNSADCIKLLDTTGHLTTLNPGGVLALELHGVGDLLGQRWADLWPEESRALASAAFTAALGGVSGGFSAACPTARGTVKWWDVVSSPVRDAGGSVREVMVVSRDVTELVRAKQAVQRADARKDALLATVAHELRNPLGAASSAAQLLTLVEHDRAGIARIAALIERQLAHISKIAEDLLDSSRVGRGGLRLTLAPVDLKAVVLAAVEQLEAGTLKKQQVLQLSLAEHGSTINGDHHRLVQAVANVLANAVRYTPAGGRINVALTRLPGQVVIAVSDTGAGIDAARLTEIFDMYAQLGANRDRRQDGLGLGLALVKAIIDLHGGDVSAESPGPGLGSTFTLRLPAVSAA